MWYGFPRKYNCSVLLISSSYVCVIYEIITNFCSSSIRIILIRDPVSRNNPGFLIVWRSFAGDRQVLVGMGYGSQEAAACILLCNWWVCCSGMRLWYQSDAFQGHLQQLLQEWCKLMPALQLVQRYQNNQHQELAKSLGWQDKFCSKWRCQLHPSWHKTPILSLWCWLHLVPL